MNKRIVLVLIILFIISSSISTLGIKSNQNEELKIGKITGGISLVQAEIINLGENDASNIEWNISITGGLFGKINRYSKGEIQSLESGESILVTCKTGFGLGNIKIKININGLEKTVNGLLVLFVTYIYPEVSLDFETIAVGLNSPVVLTHAGDDTNRLFIADQIGKIFIIQNNTLLQEPFLDISEKIVPLESVYDERGLLGLAFHPDFKNNSRFYIYYSAPKTGEGIDHESIISEFKVSTSNQNIADYESEKIILHIDQPESNHNGGQIAFGPDGFLYIGLGDGGGAGDIHNNIGNGQDINTSLGSILRINLDSEEPYSIPVDNLFVDKVGLDEIYAWGFRNPWKFSFDRETGTLIVADVGQDEWEEIDLVDKGINYGWRIMEGNHPYDPDLADLLGVDIDSLGKPIYEYSHDVGKSITGGFVYRGSISSSMYGKYIFGDWSSSFVRADGRIYYLGEIETGNWERYEFRLDQPLNRYVLSFGEDEQGEIYLLSKTTLGPSGNTGDVRKLVFN
jgi:glucose/arabinose dehydrogenase